MYHKIRRAKWGGSVGKGACQAWAGGESLKHMMDGQNWLPQYSSGRHTNAVAQTISPLHTHKSNQLKIKSDNVQYLFKVSNKKTSGNEELKFLNLSSSGRHTGRVSLLLPSFGTPSSQCFYRAMQLLIPWLEIFLLSGLPRLVRHRPPRVLLWTECSLYILSCPHEGSRAQCRQVLSAKDEVTTWYWRAYMQVHLCILHTPPAT